MVIKAFDFNVKDLLLRKDIVLHSISQCLSKILHFIDNFLRIFMRQQEQQQ